MSFGTPVTHVYNPLNYAWAAHEQYLKLAAATKKKVVFLGMTPGPFGMAQCGVPFGEITAVREWLNPLTQHIIQYPGVYMARQTIYFIEGSHN